MDKWAAPLSSRAGAKASGSVRFFDGKACKRGHVAERYTSNGQCVLCASATSAGAVLPSAGPRAEANATGSQTYLSKRACKRGHRSERWVKNRKCIACHAAQQRERYAVDPAAAKAAVAKRRARLNKAGGGCSASEIRDILRLQRGSCAYCKRRLQRSYHLDHITALANGGTNERSNLQALCPPCNCRKGTSDPASFARSIGLLV